MDTAKPSPLPLDYNSRGVQTAKSALSPRTRWTLALLGLMGFLCLALFALTPGAKLTRGSDLVIHHIALLHQGIAAALPWLLLLGIMLPVAAAVVLLARRRILAGILLLLAIVIAGIYALFMGAMARNLSPWRVYDQITAADGGRYCFMGSVGWFHGQSLAIAQERPSGFFYSHYAVLGNSKDESPQGLAVVRPAPPKTAPAGTLYQTDAGLLIGLREGNYCYFVYDPKTQRFSDNSDLIDLDLSAFILLNVTAQPYGPDIPSIIAGSVGDFSPTKESLMRDTTHPNPAVRQAAAQMLGVATSNPTTQPTSQSP